MRLATFVLAAVFHGAFAANLPKSTKVGAAYLMSDNADKNMIVSMNIHSDGTLSCGHTASAFGRGTHGLTAAGPVGFDPLFSQGPMQAHAGKAFMTLLNSESNTVAMFGINKNSPTRLTMIGAPVSSGGEFPVSMAINGDGTMACVINSGRVNALQCYSVDLKLGLTLLPNTNRPLGLNQSTPAFGPPNTLGQVIFSPDSKQVIVSVKGTSATAVGFLATYDIASDGSLAAEPVRWFTQPGGMLPFSLTPIPGQNALFVTDPNLGASVFNFGVGADNAKSAASLIPIKGQNATCWSAYSHQTGSYYAIDSGIGTVTEISLSKSLKANILKTYKFKTAASPFDNVVVTIGKNDYLLINTPGMDAVVVMALNAPGKASVIQEFNVTECAASHGLKLSINTAGMAAYLKQA